MDAATVDLASLINRLDLESTPTPRRPRRSALEEKRDSIDGQEQPSPTSGKGRKFNFQKGQAPSSAVRISQRSHSASVAETLSRKVDSFLLPSSDHEHIDESLVSDASSKRQSLRSLTSIDLSRTEWGQSEIRSVSDSFATFGKHALKDGWSFRSNDIWSLLDRSPKSDDVFSSDDSRSLSAHEQKYSSSSFMTRRSLDESARTSFEERIHRSSFGENRSSLADRYESGFILDHPSTMLPPLPPSPSPSQRLDSSPSSVRSSDSVFKGIKSNPSWVDAADSPITPEDNVTKKPFDFSEELEPLDFGDAEEQKSFAMQVDEAFKTPRKLKHRSLSVSLGLSDGVPPVPALPSHVGLQAHEIALPDSPPLSSEGDNSFSSNSASGPLDLDKANNEDLCIKHPSQRTFLGVFSRPTEGQLRSNFRFGGTNPTSGSEVPASYERSSRASDLDARSFRDSIASSNSAIGKKMSMADFFAALANANKDAPASTSRSSLALTLSDIIPPSTHGSRRGSHYSVNDDEASMLNSIFARAAEDTQEYRQSILNDGSSVFEGHSSHQRPPMHSRQNSEASFTGLSTFSEIRRGFEYGPSRPGFYPPANPQFPDNHHLLVPGHQWRDSLISLASVSSYGHVLRSGAKDPFGYANPTTSTANHPRPISGDLSITVDDTFSFLKRGIRPRQDSNASSLRPTAQRRPNVNLRRTRRQGIDSMASVNSGPPVSLYNRGFSYYGSKQNDANIAAQLVHLTRANSHLLRERTSIDSMASGFSARQLGRPGIGDKMFESARDHGIPLSAIAASPSQVESSQMMKSSAVDEDSESLLDQVDAGDANSTYSHNSVFDAGQEKLSVHPMPALYRPVSAYSFETNYSPKQHDASVISVSYTINRQYCSESNYVRQMLGGGHVSRQSIESSFDGSPCARAEKRNRRQFYRHPLERIPSGDAAELLSVPQSATVSANSSLTSLNDAPPSPASRRSNHSLDQFIRPDESRVSLHFGSNRMSMARNGLLERQSLEDFCLTGEGEDSEQPSKL